MKIERFLLAMILALAGSAGTVMGVNNLRHDDITQATQWYGVIKKIPPYVIDANMTPSFLSVTYYLQGDTVINDTLYYALYRNEGEYCAGLRKSEDGKKVYIRPTYHLLNDQWWDSSKPEHLLYDFGVQKGDTVWAFDGSYSGQDDMGRDTSTQYSWIVKDVQTIDGRMHIWVEGGQMRRLVEWIEGVGSRYILFENVYEDAMYYSYSTWALCATDSEGDVIYSFDTDDIGIHNKQCEWEEIHESIVPIQGNTSNSAETTKVILDGQILILRGDKTYTIEGQVVNDGL